MALSIISESIPRILRYHSHYDLSNLGDFTPPLEILSLLGHVQEGSEGGDENEEERGDGGQPSSKEDEFHPSEVLVDQLGEESAEEEAMEQPQPEELGSQVEISDSLPSVRLSESPLISNRPQQPYNQEIDLEKITYVVDNKLAVDEYKELCLEIDREYPIGGDTQQYEGCFSLTKPFGIHCLEQNLAFLNDVSPYHAEIDFCFEEVDSTSDAFSDKPFPNFSTWIEDPSLKSFLPALSARAPPNLAGEEDSGRGSVGGVAPQLTTSTSPEKKEQQDYRYYARDGQPICKNTTSSISPPKKKKTAVAEVEKGSSVFTSAADRKKRREQNKKQLRKTREAQAKANAQQNNFEAQQEPSLSDIQGDRNRPEVWDEEDKGEELLTIELLDTGKPAIESEGLKSATHQPTLEEKLNILRSIQERHLNISKNKGMPDIKFPDPIITTPTGFEAQRTLHSAGNSDNSFEKAKDDLKADSAPSAGPKEDAQKESKEEANAEQSPSPGKKKKKKNKKEKAQLAKKEPKLSNHQQLLLEMQAQAAVSTPVLKPSTSSASESVTPTASKPPQPSQRSLEESISLKIMEHMNQYRQMNQDSSIQSSQTRSPKDNEPPLFTSHSEKSPGKPFSSLNWVLNLVDTAKQTPSWPAEMAFNADLSSAAGSLKVAFPAY